jgi:low affinity Fe/Cu permease
MTVTNIFGRVSNVSASLLGSPWMFAANVFLILIWLFAGPFFNYSDTWQLVVNTATTVITYLAVFLIQNTQNRDARAVHLKLDELISSIDGARNRFVDLEDVSDEELAILTNQFKQLRERAKAGDVDAVQGLTEELDKHIDDAGYIAPDPLEKKP